MPMPLVWTFNPLWNHYRCADDRWIALGMLQADRYWKDFCRTIGADQLADDPRFADTRSRLPHCGEAWDDIERLKAAGAIWA